LSARDACAIYKKHLYFAFCILPFVFCLESQISTLNSHRNIFASKISMSKRRSIAPIASLLTLLTIGLLGQSAKASDACPAALDQVQSYRVAAGDTLASVAANHRLQPDTLSSFNSGVGNSPSPGSTLQIPPFNGRAVTVAAGESWQSLAERYGSRADLLFEVNGCVADVPSRIFLPGVNLITASSPEATSLPGYPLAQPTNIALSYGWQPHATRDELVFNSGIAFAIAQPVDVLAVDGGTIAFAGEREGYGQLLVINHAGGLQTRYANLSDISVSTGQAVTADMVVGRVGSGTPTYLYFEVRTNSASGWIAEDPGKYLPALELR
jgi:murein DD-endopeptidase MepM/ murein hydrolase activator NlpD